MATTSEKASNTQESGQAFDLLYNHVGFGCLAESDINKLADNSTIISLKNGEMLFEKDDISNCFYVLKSGTATGDTPSFGGEKITTYRLGDLIGFLGVISNKPRKNSVRADCDAELIKIEKDDFDEIFSGRQELKGVLIAEYDLHGFKGTAAQKSTFHDQLPPELYQHLPLSKLREKITSKLSNSFFNNTISKEKKLHDHNDLLNSMMAGCALVSSDKGGFGFSEYQYIHCILERLSALGNLSIDYALQKFNHYGSAIISDPDKGKKEALIALSHVSNGGNNAKIVLSVCHAMSVIHIGGEEKASQILKEISERLGVSIDDL